MRDSGHFPLFPKGEIRRRASALRVGHGNPDTVLPVYCKRDITRNLWQRLEALAGRGPREP